MLIKSAVCWCWLNLLLISFSLCLSSSQLMCSGGFFFFFFFFFSASLSLQDILGRLTWVRHSRHKSSATRSYQCVQYFPCVQTMLYILGRLTWVRHSRHKSSATHSYQCVQHFPCVQTMLCMPVLGMFNMHTCVDAWDCAEGLYGHCKRLCIGSWLWEKIPFDHRELEPTSVLHLAF